MAELHRTAGGVPVLIRPIRPDDKQILREGLERLSPASSRARFLTAKPRFTNDELRYLTEVDGSDHVAVLAVFADDPSRLAAVARYVRLAEDPGTAEIAIVVADELQGQGLGRKLGLMLSDHARAAAVQRFVALMLSDNVPAHRLFATIAENLTTEHDQGVDRLLVSLAA
jgi:RimJ/RimL family protein N-acetyltransferase